MTDLMLTRAGADLAYQVTGDGPFLGYSHGVMSSRAADDALGVLGIGALAAKRRLLRYDARAHGRSTGRRLTQDYTWPSLADDLLALTELSASAPLDWAGSSMGTGTLLWAAVRRPGRFRRLVLTIPPTTGPTRSAAAGMYESWARTIETEGREKWVAGLVQLERPAIFETLDGYRLDADVTEELLPSVLRGAATTDLPPAGALAAIEARALILAWESDPVHPVSTAEYLHDTMPRTELHVSATVEDVRTWTDRIEAFLES